MHLKRQSPFKVVQKALTFISSIEASFCASFFLRRSDVKWKDKKYVFNYWLSYYQAAVSSALMHLTNKSFTKSTQLLTPKIYRFEENNPKWYRDG